MNELIREISVPGKRSSAMLSSLDHGNLALTKIFSDLCGRLSKSIMQQKPIQERTLLDFSRISITIINHGLDKITDSFQNLSRLIDDYWHYGLKHETNQNRGYSYIRVYQMVNMLYTFYTDRELECRAHAAVNENYNNAELIMRIRQFPGITYRKLRTGSEETPEILQNKLHSLEKNGYVVGQRSGEERYYILTNAGDTLYRHLVLKTQRQWVDQWSTERILVLCFTLLCLREQGVRPVLVQDVEQKVASLNDKEIEIILDSAINYKRKRTSSENRVYLVKDAGIYIEEDIGKVSQTFNFERISSKM